jgi:uroporphyrinogen-III synthase
MTPEDRIYCWSEMQAETLQTLGLPVEVTSYANAAELAERVVDQNRGQSVLFLHGDKLHSEINALFNNIPVQYSEVEVYKNTPIEKFVSGIFDAYLFFSPSGIDGFFAHPDEPKFNGTRSLAFLHKYGISFA